MSDMQYQNNLEHNDDSRSNSHDDSHEIYEPLTSIYERLRNSSNTK